MPATNNAPAPDSGGLHTVSGAGEYLKTSERRVWELLRSGVLAAVRDGRAVKITTVELERYIRELPAYEPVAS